MVSNGKLSVKLFDRPLFIKKVTAVFAATLVLVPLVYFKLFVPAWIYVSGLLLLHLIFLYIYFSKMPWRRLMKHKAAFALRLLAVGFFGYLLVVLKFHGSLAFVIANLAAGLAIHTIILFSLMAEVELAPAP